MLRFTKRRVVAIMTIAAFWFPASLQAQTAEDTANGFDAFTVAETRTYHKSLSAMSLQSAGQDDARKGLTGGQKMAIAAGIGAGAGLVFGELVLGQRLDYPHGPDMLFGASIGAHVGILGVVLGRLIHRDDSKAGASRGPVTVRPVLSPSRKGVTVTLSLH